MAIVLGLGFTSCTTERLDDDQFTETVASDSEKKDPTITTEPND
ncbi:hypothetical protein [Algibacter sp. 2305UL17-15]